MAAEPKNWEKYYHGSDNERRIQRHFSYSDRVRYYWPHPEIDAAVKRLLELLGDRDIPETLVSQYLRVSYPSVRANRIRPQAAALASDAVDLVLEDYFEACRP
jgi:D-tagatose-1,6-bisphosphate aldolase subunit GatZ/KbaZ